MKKEKFKLKSQYKPKGSQPEAIKNLARGLKTPNNTQTLLGVTGSGKTFTMANIIQQYNKPTIVLAPNKTLVSTSRPISSVPKGCSQLTARREFSMLISMGS